MPTTEYPKNPNVDTVFVTDDGGKRTRAVKTVLLNGTVDYPKNSNSQDCYVTVDGKKQRALMTVDISTAGTLEYPDNSNSTKGYVTVGGKKQRVTLTAALVGGGSSPVVDELNVTPSVTSQTFTPSSGVDGFNPVNVSAVTSAIDSNIQPDYIRNGINILGVTGTFVGTGTVIDPLNVTPSVTSQTITASGGVDGYSPINVSAVTSAIDSSIVASNIKSGVTILGVTGNVTELDGETVTITPSVTSQTITPTAPHNAITAATVNAVTSAIDSNIAASNIKSGVTILGVTGNVTELNGNTLNVTPTTSSQTIAPTSPYNAFTDVNVSAVTSAIDSSIVASNIKNGVTILGVTGDYTGGAPTRYIEKGVDANGYLISAGSNIINLSGVTKLRDYALTYAYNGNSSLTGIIDMSDIEEIDGNYCCEGMLRNCTGITKILLSNLETVNGSNVFSSFCEGASSLQETDVSKLKTISGTFTMQSMFNECDLRTLVFDSLESITAFYGGAIGNGMLANNINLTLLSFPKLSVISGPFCNASYAPMAGGCYKLESVSFGGVKASTFANETNQIPYLFNNTTGKDAPNGCTVHFPSNFDPSDPNHTFDASTIQGYPTFGGSSAYIHVAFDLPATE